MTTTTTEAATALHLECPDWCTEAGDDSHAVDWAYAWRDRDGYVGPTLVREHTGPTFGAFTCGGQRDAVTGEVYVSVDLDDVLATRQVDGGANSENLHQFARDARRAALWLEAHMQEWQR